MIRDISIVIPIYNEQDNIIQLIKEIRAVLEKKINFLPQNIFFILPQEYLY